MSRPLIHFLLLGGLLFALDRLLLAPAMPLLAPAMPPRDGSAALVFPTARVETIRRTWSARTGSSPSAAELEALLQAEIDDEVLFREALARGLDRDDPVVQRRLIQNMQFLTPHASDEAAPPGRPDAPLDAALLRQADALGLAQSDPVVRRRLIQRMQLRLETAAEQTEPSDAELESWLKSHPDRFVGPDRLTLTQVFLSRDRRGATLEADARRLLARLEPEDADSARAAVLSDPFPLPTRFQQVASTTLARGFGPGFAEAVTRLEPGHWAGPLVSAYGLHLVWVHERIPGAPPGIETVRTQLREAVMAERRRQAVETALRELRQRYRIQVERPEGRLGQRGASSP